MGLDSPSLFAYDIPPFNVYRLHLGRLTLAEDVFIPRASSDGITLLFHILSWLNHVDTPNIRRYP